MFTYAQRELRKGSFRGVEFETTSSDLIVGRRVQVFEYPQRDIPFVEDLGRSARTVKFTAFVVGQDYIERMNKLIGALEQSGSGTLIHPWLGQMTVTPKAVSSVKFTSRLRTASVTLEFIESGEYKFPTTEADTGSLTRQMANLVKDSAIANFVDNFNLDNVQDFVVSAVSGNLAEYMQLDAIKAVGTLFHFSDQISDIASDALSLVSGDPKVLANNIANALGLGSYVTTVNNWRRVSRQLSRLVRSEDLDKSNKERNISTTTASTIDAATKQIETLIRGVLVSNVVGASSLVGTSQDRLNESEAIQTMAYDEMISVRDDVLSAIDSEMLKATNDDVYKSLEQSRTAVWEDMTTRAERQARLIDFTPNVVMPALVLAYDYYGDASREGEIVERNNIAHAGFVPVKALKLLSE